LLAREVTGDSAASLVAGMIYGFSPYVLSFPVGSGVAETSFLFPLPLIVLFGLRTITRDSWANPALTAGLLLLQGLAAWSYGIYGALFLFGVAISFVVTRVRGRDDSLFGEARLDRRLFLRVGFFVAILLIAATPFFLQVQGTVSGDDAMYQRHLNIFPGPGPKPTEEPALTSFAWVDFFTPGTAGRRADMYTDKLLYVAYMGFAALGLALAGWRRRGAATFAGLASLFFLFALGPLFFAGQARTFPAWTNPVYLVFYYAFPLFNATIHSVDRFAVPFQLALGVAAAVGLARFMKHVPDRRQMWLGGAVAALILIETLLISPAPWPVPASPAKPDLVALELATAPRDGAVLDLPPYHGGTGLFDGDIFFQQTVHGLPIPYNLEGVSPTVYDNPFYAHVEAILLEGITSHGIRRPPPVPACEGVARLAGLGFSWVVLRPERLAPSARNRVVDLIESCLGEGRKVGSSVLYALPAAVP